MDDHFENHCWKDVVSPEALGGLCRITKEQPMHGRAACFARHRSL